MVASDGIMTKMGRFETLDGDARRQAAEHLWSMWQQPAKRQAVVLTGESGIGKSRHVVQPLMDLVRGDHGIAVSVDIPASPVNIEAHLFGKLLDECDDTVKQRLSVAKGFFPAIQRLLREQSLVVIDEFQRALDDNGDPIEPFATQFRTIAEKRGAREGCLLLVSSREIDQTWTEPFCTQPLGRPSAEDAVGIVLGRITLERRAEAFPADRHHEVVNRLGRNPRALRLLGGLLRLYTLEELLGRPEPLAAPADSRLVHDIEKSLVDKAADGLSGSARAALRDLSVLEDWAEAGLVQAVIGIDGPVHNNDMIRQLRERYLVEADPTGPVSRRVVRYQVHPAVREVDRVRLYQDESAWREAHLRAGAWFAKDVKIHDVRDRQHQARLAMALAGVQRHYMLAQSLDRIAQVIAPVASEIEHLFGGEYPYHVPDSMAEVNARIALLDAYFAHAERENVHLRYHMARLLTVRAKPDDLARALAHAEKATEACDSYYPWVERTKLTQKVKGERAAIDVADEGLRRVHRDQLSDRSANQRFALYGLAAQCLAFLGDPRAAFAKIRTGCAETKGKNRFRLAQAAPVYAAAEPGTELLDDVCRWLASEREMTVQEHQGKILQAMSRGQWDEAAKLASAARRHIQRNFVEYAIYESIALTAIGKPSDAQQALDSFPGGGIPNSRRRSRKSELREGKAWLAAFVALQNGDVVRARRWLAMYLGTDAAEWTTEELRSRLLSEWDHRIATIGEANPAYTAPILPAAMTGHADAKRPQHGPPVLPAPRTVQAEEPPAPTQQRDEPQPVVIALGDIVMNSKYNLPGSQIGAVGDNATATNFSLGPTNDGAAKSDLIVLIEELTELRNEMRAHSTTSEEGEAVAAVDEAIAAAREGDATRIEQRVKALGTAGKWAAGLATSIGATVAAAYLKTVLGI